jgi:hypothetical protein
LLPRIKQEPLHLRLEQARGWWWSPRAMAITVGVAVDVAVVVVVDVVDDC